MEKRLFVFEVGTDLVSVTEKRSNCSLVEQRKRKVTALVLLKTQM
jgi:hypothetical protein